MTEDGWITKAQAAAILQCDERTIERRARAGLINARTRLGFPTRYWAADVETLASGGSQVVRTGILAAVSPGNGNGNRSLAPHPSGPASSEELLGKVCQALLTTLTTGSDTVRQVRQGPTGPAYVSRAEARAIAGISDEELRTAVKAGEIRQRGRRYRRVDVEGL